MRKLMFVTMMCVFFMTVEIIGGYLSGSLAIMADAAHLFSDVVGFVISYFAVRMGSKDASFKMSFGYHRTEILGAMASIIIIWVLLIWLVKEAVNRLIHTNYEIDGEIMLITALIGLCCNIINIFVLEGCAKVPDNKDEMIMESEYTPSIRDPESAQRGLKPSKWDWIDEGEEDAAYGINQHAETDNHLEIMKPSLQSAHSA